MRMLLLNSGFVLALIRMFFTSVVSYFVPGTRLELAVAGQNLLAEFRDEIEPDPDDMSQVTTPAGTHRENPLGQSIPLSVQATLTYRLW